MTESITEALVAECERRRSSCEFTSVGLYQWLGRATRRRQCVLGIGIFAGAVGSWSVLQQSPHGVLFTAGMVLVASLLPALHEGLGMKNGVDEIRRLAGEFRNLSDAYRKAAMVYASLPFAEFDAHVRTLDKRIDDLRVASLPIPYKYYREAERKIAAGDYAYGTTPRPPRGLGVRIKAAWQTLKAD